MEPDGQLRPPLTLVFATVVFSTAGLRHFAAPVSLTVWTAGTVTLAVIFALLAAGKSPPIRRGAMVALVALVAVHGSIVFETLHHPADHPVANWIGEQRRTAEIEARIVDGPIVHDRGVSFDAELLSIDTDPDGELTEQPPRIRVFYPTESHAACLRLPLPGDRVSTWAELRRFRPAETHWRRSQRALMEHRGYVAQSTVREALQYGTDVERSPVVDLKRRLARHRIGLERRIGGHLDGDALAISQAMLTGSRGLLTAEFREPFNITSTGHIMAISGLHFAVIAAIIAWLIKLMFDRFPRLYLKRPRRVIIGAITLVFLVGYLMAIGAPVSAQRAFGMTAIAIAVVCLSPWRLRPLSAVCVVGSMLLLIRPSMIAEAGFQLSFCATAGILLFLKFRPPLLRDDPTPGPESESRLSGWLRRLATFAGLSVSATLATWPVLWRMTGELPVAGLWANLVVVPLVGSVLFPLLVAGAAATYISSTAAGLLLWLSTRGLLAIHAGLDAIAYSPSAVIRAGTPTTMQLWLAFIGVGALLVGGLRVRAWAAAGSVAAVIAIAGVATDHLEPDRVRIHFIDVGQGDAALIETPDGSSVLVDGGGRPVGSDPGLNRVVPYLRHRGIRRLDAVVLTHPDYDHYGGLFAVARPFRPKSFYVDADDEHPRVAKLKDAFVDVGTTIEGVDGPAIIETDDIAIRLDRPEVFGADPNDRSLFATFSHAGAGVLLAGDAEADAEAWLVDHLPAPMAVTNAPHHGSNTSSTPRFIDHFTPAVAVASAGRHNTFGHPHPDVVERYAARDIDLFRTDENGSVIAEIDDRGRIEVRTAR